MNENDSKIEGLRQKLEQEKEILKKLELMESLIKDRSALSRCKTETDECRKSIDYFNNAIEKIKEKSTQVNDSSSSNNNVENTGNASDKTGAHPRTSSMQPDQNRENVKKYSTLDLLTAQTEYSKPKVSLKLHELEYKLDVEKKVLAGAIAMSEIDKNSPGYDKRIAELRGQQDESKQKVNLLNSALKKYQKLYIDEGDDDDNYELETPPSARMPPGFRRPVTGKLSLGLIEAHGLAHGPTRTYKDPDTVVYIKIDGNVVFTSKPSKVLNDTWDDKCEIEVNKAAEVEVSIYDEKDGRKLPIGIFWLKISDITEGLRKKKIQQENGPGWVPATDYVKQENDSNGLVAQQQVQKQQLDDKGIDTWFDVEPSGEIHLCVNFVREAVNRRPLDKLGRAGAVRQRRGEVHEMNGHQFVEKKFYNIMRCALCDEFMANNGYQCEDCEYSCHKKCYSKVVTKCKANTGIDADEDKLNHRIPHRFEPIRNIGANWCCHCGYVLPLGSKEAKKCSECKINCHTKCQRFIPDFCGLSMDMANQMLAEIKAASKRKTVVKPPPSVIPNTSTSATSAPGRSSNELASQLSYLTVNQNKQLPDPYAKQQPKQQHILPAPPSTPSHALQQQQQPLPQMPQIQQQQQSPQQIKQQQLQQQNQVQYPQSQSQHLQTQSPNQPGNRQVTLNDFNFLFVLGKGNFGKVMLAEDKYDKRLYAVKILKKRFIIDNDEIESLRSEKRIFQAASKERHPFLIGLQSCFQTESRVYFVMEYVSGGDLMWHIQREPFSERRARFYACEVLLALEYFHEKGIIYRDLKLDNIMLSLDGHVKVADYGLCKENMFFGNTTGTFCGTPEFMAPEILLEQKYGRAIDWWAFGVLTYEMLLGQSPFKGEDEDEIFDAILEDEILYPVNMSRDSVSICQRLLTRDPKKRLGSGPEGAKEIKEHPFFSGVNWDDMLSKRVPPPFCPTINGPLDTSNFDEEFTKERPALTPIDSILTKIEQQEFTKFSYVADWTHQNGPSLY